MTSTNPPTPEQTSAQTTEISSDGAQPSAEDIAVTREAHLESSARNRIPALVRSVTLEGPLARVELDCGFPLVALVTAQSAEELELRAGERVCAVIKATSVHLVR